MQKFSQKNGKTNRKDNFSLDEMKNVKPGFVKSQYLEDTRVSHSNKLFLISLLPTEITCSYFIALEDKTLCSLCV